MSIKNTSAERCQGDLGVLIVEAGEVVAALGSARTSGVQQSLLAAMKRPDMRSKLFSFDLPNHCHVAVIVTDGPTQIGLVRPADDERTLVEFVAAVPFSFAILNHFLADPYQAINVVDEDGVIRFMSSVHERYLGLRAGEGIGKPAREVIPNSRLAEVAMSGKAEIAKLQDINGVTRVVNRRPIMHQGRVVGAIGQVFFKEPEAMARMNREMTRLRTEVEVYRRELNDLRDVNASLAELVGDSDAMRRLKKEIVAVARLDVPVLILGASGTGKELVARAIHAIGRPQKPLVSLNLAALPASLIESELFGHVGGAFTGGSKDGRIGKFELANEGTLFLDELGDIPLEIQTKLLRVIEARRVERLGSHQAHSVTFRLVSATHRDMPQIIDAGTFRADLFYRNNGVTLRMPPLSERLSDIPALLTHFVNAFCRRNELPTPVIGAGVARYLATQDWPGNVRQLRQRVEEALVFCDGECLTVEAFVRNGAVSFESRRSTLPAYRAVSAGSGMGGHRLKDAERQAVLQAISDCNGNKKKAAERLGISRSYLYKVLAANE